MRLDAQGRVTIPQRLRDVVGIKKEVVVLGVRERMEIWDRGEFERYRDVHAAAYEYGELEPRGRCRGRCKGPPKDPTDGPKESVMQTKLSTEVRQSLSLLAMTAVTLLASIGLGILAGQLG